MEIPLGLRSAKTLVELGLSSDAVVRGLMHEVGLTQREAALASSVAEAARAMDRPRVAFSSSLRGE